VGESVEVEIVGGLVEQEDVEARQERGGERRPSGLPPESDAVGCSAMAPSSPSSASVAPMRASRSAPPSAIQRSSASL
jgi:hypothetical protein